MDERSEALKVRFFSDAEEYLSRSKTLLADLVAGRAADDDIHELFRCIHSIKSEASYLKLQSLSEISHALEEKLEAFRIGSVDVASLAAAERMLQTLDNALLDEQSTERATGWNVGPVFNEFEMRLLSDAEARGEQFYRVRCDLDPETPMKQARAYLLLSNLEQISNVIRMEPSVHCQDDELFGSVRVYLTAYTDESEIYRALDIDQIVGSTVDVVDFGLLEADSVKRTGMGGSSAAAPQMLYRLGSRKLSQLIAYADELKITFKELDLDLSKELEASHSIRGRITRMSHLCDGLFDGLRLTRTARLSEEFQRLDQMVTDLAAELGKRVRIEVKGGGIEVDRRNLMALSEPLSHLVRNAVDHGIEMPDVRLAAGKFEEGRIGIAATEDAKHLTIIVSDDGIGIDEGLIRARVSETGDSCEGDLIELISRPGFTTLVEATGVSGRGVGLDLVMQRVVSVGGDVRLDSVTGRGTSFELKIPSGSSYSQVLFFRYRGELYAVSSGVVVEVKKIARGDLKRSGSGRVFYQGRPAYAGDAEATVGGSKQYDPPYGRFAILTSDLGQDACFLADDVLFEHDVQNELLKQGGSEGRKRLAIRFGSGRREFFYLSPTLVSTSIHRLR